MLPSPLPEELQRMIDARSAELEPALGRGDYTRAIAGYREMYTDLFAAQPSGQRYHKGLPLQNIGAALLFQGSSINAYQYFVAAYVEDLLSRPPDQGGPPRDTPAARTLLLVYGVREDGLRAFDERVLNAARDPDLARDPMQIVRAVGVPAPTVTHEAVLERVRVKTLREPGRFPVSWEERVFVGGSYQSNFAVLREIERYVRDRGRFPVVAADYRVVRDIHHHSLMLLHECRLAIFDISHEAGQQMEIGAALEWGVEVLVVRQTGDPNDLRIGGMLRGLLDQHNVHVMPYETLAELEALVADFLARNP